MGQVVKEEAEPTVDLNVPVGQDKHGPPVGPKKPAAQVQLLGDWSLEDLLSSRAR